MLSLFKQFAFVTLASALVLGGCGGDGRNASDNPTTAPQFVSSSGSAGGTGAALPLVGAPLALNSDISGSVDTAKAVIDGAGNITVVWTQSDGTYRHLWSSRYNTSLGQWSNAQRLDSSGLLDVTAGDKGFQLVVDGSGNVTVAWTQGAADSYMSGSTPVDVVRTDLWSVRYYATGGWGTAGVIEHSDLAAAQTQNIEDIGEFQTVIDGAGNVTVLWTQNITGSGGVYNIYANRSVAGVWQNSSDPSTPPPPLNSEHLGDAGSPQLLLDSTGNLFALWIQSNAAVLNLWGARYAAATWSAATEINSVGPGDVEAPVGVVDGSGNATIAWRQFDGTFWSLWTARSAAGTWGAAALAEAQNGDVTAPQLQLYGTSNLVLLWGQTDGTVNNIWSKQFDGSTWSANATITTGAGDAGSLVTVKDGVGNVTAAWLQHDNTAVPPQDSLWASRFSGTWGTPTTIETSSTGDAVSPMLMVDAVNRVTAVWLQKNSGRFDLWSNRYVSGGWGTAALVESLTDGSAVDPHGVVSNSGNITLVWRQPYGSGNYLLTNNYTVGAAGGWGTVADVEPQDSEGGYSPLLLVNSSGIVTVVWLQPVVSGPTVRIDIWANRF